EEGGEASDRHHRGRGARAGAAPGVRRREGLRRGRDLVGAETRGAQGAEVGADPFGCRRSCALRRFRQATLSPTAGSTVAGLGAGASGTRRMRKGLTRIETIAAPRMRL